MTKEKQLSSSLAMTKEKQLWNSFGPLVAVLGSSSEQNSRVLTSGATMGLSISETPEVGS